MPLMLNLCTLTLRKLIGGACQAVGLPVGDAAVAGVATFLAGRFVNQSQRLTTALQTSNARAWKALEVALAGTSFWDRCKRFLASSEEKSFGDQVRPFLDACPLAELQGKDAYRQACLQELKAADKAGALTEGKLDPAELARRAGAF